MSKLTGVYEIVCKADGMRIIGSCGDIKRRWSTYKSQLKRGIYKNALLQAAVNTYGLDNFDFVILEECDEDDLYIRENYYLSQYEDDELYNIRGIRNTYKKVKTEEEKIATARSLSRANSGSKNPNYSGKLSVDDVIRIKVMIAQGLSNKQIHSEFEFKTTNNMISRIRTGNRYASVQPKIEISEHDSVDIDSCLICGGELEIVEFENAPEWKNVCPEGHFEQYIAFWGQILTIEDIVIDIPSGGDNSVDFDILDDYLVSIGAEKLKRYRRVSVLMN